MSRSARPVTGPRLLDGEVAIVTGAAEGPKAALGSRIAMALAEQGAAVVAADVADCGSVVARMEEAGGVAVAVQADVSEEADVRALVAHTVSTLGPPTILVNNAAYGSNIPPVPIRDLSVAAWDRAMTVNLRGSFLCAREVCGHMERNRWGKIVNIGSATALEGLPDRLHYVTSKGGIHTMTRALARELGPAGIRVNTVAPGLVMNDSVGEVMAGREGVLQHILDARAVPEHVSADALLGAVSFLASHQSDALTGQCLVVDNGGMFVG